MFLDYLTNDPAYYLTVVSCVIISIVLHELGHGLAAISQGDDTPIRTGHITLSPFVHMGGMGLAMLFVAGIAFGVMPVDPSRFRNRHGDALVAAAGPGVNLAIGIACLTSYGILLRSGIEPGIGGTDPLWIIGQLNLVLCGFNLIPIAPLDGSAILGSFVPAYRDFIRRPENGKYIWIMFGIVFFGAPRLFSFGAEMATLYIRWIVNLQ